MTRMGGLPGLSRARTRRGGKFRSPLHRTNARLFDRRPVDCRHLDGRPQVRRPRWLRNDGQVRRPLWAIAATPASTLSAPSPAGTTSRVRAVSASRRLFAWLTAFSTSSGCPSPSAPPTTMRSGDTVAAIAASAMPTAAVASLTRPSACLSPRTAASKTIVASIAAPLPSMPLGQIERARRAIASPPANDSISPRKEDAWR